jgi:hypothetical protein
MWRSGHSQVPESILKAASRGLPTTNESNEKSGDAHAFRLPQVRSNDLGELLEQKLR